MCAKTKLELIKENIKPIFQDIKIYSKDPEKVILLPTTKYVDKDGVNLVNEAGLLEVGENRVQALEEKYNQLKSSPFFSKIKWHFIGNLQRNKVKYIAPYIHLIHSVNKLSLIKEIDKEGRKNNRIIPILLEVNISEEETKQGYTVKSLYEDLELIRSFQYVEVKGLMTMAPFTQDERVIRETFRGLRTLKDQLNSDYFHGSLTELSMGMSNDYKIALEEGATILRIGRNIFKNII